MVPRHAAAPLETLVVAPPLDAKSRRATLVVGLPTPDWRVDEIRDEAAEHTDSGAHGLPAEVARFLVEVIDRLRGTETDLARTKKQRTYVAQVLGGITMESTEGGENVDRLADLTLDEVERLRKERTVLLAALSDLYDLGRQESIEDGDLEAAQANARSALRFARESKPATVAPFEVAP